MKTPFYHLISGLCGMAERDRKARLLLMLSAFFDESCKEPSQGPCLFMAGFLGRAEVWEKLSDAWHHCLHSDPPIEFYKSSESYSVAEQFKGQFRGMGEKQINQKRVVLAKVIADYPEVRGVCVLVPHTAFVERRSKTDRRMPLPYDCAFVQTVSLVMRYTDASFPSEDKVDFIFDQCSEFKACRDLFERLKEDKFFGPSLMRRAGKCEKDDDRKILALQMSDLLAGECSLLPFGERSEAFQIIHASNGVLIEDGTPPSHMGATFQAHNLGAEVEREKAALHKWLFKAEYTDDEANARIEKLLAMNALFRETWEKTREQIENDSEYQEFDRLYRESEEN